MPPRTWFYEGETFVSPEFRQSGKPFIVNAEIKKLWLDSLPKPKTLKQKILEWFNTAKANYEIVKERDIQQRAKSQTLAEMEKKDIEDSKEDSELDGLMSEGDEFFPEEF